MTEIRLAELRAVPSVTDGLDRLKEDILHGRKVLCVCGAGRDYHVGAHDASDTLNRAVNRDYLIRRGAEIAEDQIFVPTNPTAELASRLSEEETACSAEVKRAYSILKESYPAYERGVRLSQQPDDIRQRLLTAFRKLRALGFLPPTTGGPAFNHQGLVLLMERCFRSRSRLVQYLRNPNVLVDEPRDELEAANLDRLRLLRLRLTEGGLSAEAQQRLERARATIRKTLPDDAEQARALDELILDVKDIHERAERRDEELRKIR